jgi:predicted RNA-binding protein associated with RNAse of E/G family
MDDKFTQRAVRMHEILIASGYMRGEELEFDIEEDEKSSVGEYLFELCDHFALPVTNSADVNRDLIDIGDFMSAVRLAFESAGWVSPKDHQRAVEEARRSAC